MLKIKILKYLFYGCLVIIGLFVLSVVKSCSFSSELKPVNPTNIILQEDRCFMASTYVTGEQYHASLELEHPLGEGCKRLVSLNYGEECYTDFKKNDNRRLCPQQLIPKGTKLKLIKVGYWSTEGSKGYYIVFTLKGFEVTGEAIGHASDYPLWSQYSGITTSDFFFEDGEPVTVETLERRYFCWGFC